MWRIGWDKSLESGTNSSRRSAETMEDSSRQQRPEMDKRKKGAQIDLCNTTYGQQTGVIAIKKTNRGHCH